MNLRLVLIAAKACLVSSMVARTEEGYGFEIVSDIGQWLEMEATNIAFVPDRSFLRGSNYTDFDTVDEGRDFDSEMDEDLEVNYEWNSNATLIDYKNGDPDERQLAQLSARDRQWLNSHNKRRRKYHKKFNKKYVPLKWSPKLKRRSKKWAKHLANQCGRKGIYHDPQNSYGENLASNWGTGTWARKPSTDSVLTRLVENEEGLNYPKNGHFTQVLWRGTSFVGCAEHTKEWSGKKCHVQVCRYAKPGNCNMGRYKNYKVPMLADDSPCGPSI